MGHVAQKNRLRHGYKVTTTGTGQAMVYTSDRPTYFSRKGKKDNRGRGYANVERPTRVMSGRGPKPEAVVKELT